MASTNTNLTQVFDQFRAELDEHNDRRERLIKASRDITNLSKKAIFLLHRIAMEENDMVGEECMQKAGKTGRERLREIPKIYAGMKDDLKGDRFWRYERQVSPGLQEYIEALSFAHFLEHRTLITHEQVQETLLGPNGEHLFPLTISDYLLGVSDLTGELMRFAISGIGQRAGRAKANVVCTFVRACKADFERFIPYVRDLAKKQAVTTQSLEKIEDAAYALVVRASEYELPPDMMDDYIARSISSTIPDRRHKISDDSSDLMNQI